MTSPILSHVRPQLTVNVNHTCPQPRAAPMSSPGLGMRRPPPLPLGVRSSLSSPQLRLALASLVPLALSCLLSQNPFLMDEFVDVIRLIEELFFVAALGNTKDALNTLYQAIKLLNQLARDEYDVEDILRFCMNHYDKIKLKLYTVSQRLLWLLLRLAPARNHRLLVTTQLLATTHTLTGSLLSRGLVGGALSLGDTVIGDDDVALMPPVIQFSAKELLLEFDREPPTDSNLLPLPPGLEAEFQRIQFSHWAPASADLYQDLLPNCSFVLLLLLVQAKQDLLPLVLPHKPLTNYRVKLHFNGCWRIVTVDNSLPLIRRLARLLIVRLLSDPLLMWPALIEKAYLKVMGQGYEFAGLNMARDTYMLTGWVPEIVVIKHFQLPQEFDDVWKQNLLGFCTVGVGTGALSKLLSDGLNLTPNHDYVVEYYVKDKEEITVKNPWGAKDRQRLVTIHNRCPFQYLYINWDVKRLFKYLRLVNFVYLAQDDATLVLDAPQYSLVNPTNEEIPVWVFLESHLLAATLARPTHHTVGFLVYKTLHGERVLLPTQYVRASEAQTTTNDHLRLVKLVVAPNLSYTMVTLANITGTFSLTVYDNVGLTLEFGKASHLYPNVHLLDGALDFRNSGGSWAHSLYIYNPQWDVQVKDDAVVAVVAVFAARLDTMINVHLFSADAANRGLPIRTFDKARLVANENYAPGYQLYRFDHLPRGLYKMVVLAYDPRVVEKFKVYFNYLGTDKSRVSVHSILTLLGLFVKQMLFDWDNRNRCKIGFRTEGFHCRFTIHVTNFSDDALVVPGLPPLAQTAMVELITNYRPAIRGLVFAADDGAPIQVNTEWDNSVYGLFIDVTIGNPGTYILLLERFEPNRGRCVVEFGCNKAFDIAG